MLQAGQEVETSGSSFLSTAVRDQRSISALVHNFNFIYLIGLTSAATLSHTLKQLKTKSIDMKQLLFSLIALSIISCNPTSEKKPETPSVNVDSLTANFLAGWNNKDSAAIMNTIADNAIVMNDSLIHNGHQAIADNWISGGVKVLSNIKTSSVIKNYDNLLAYDGGTYTLDLTPPGGSLLKEKGNYSLVWTKQQNGEWKLTLIHIEDITRMPDIK